MPSFSDSVFLFVLALLLFGPKKLPVLARELGKWVGEFRRASNEFKMQMEEELRVSEQEDRQKKIAAMEAAAPVAQPAAEIPEPEHPHLPTSTSADEIVEVSEVPLTTVTEHTETAAAAAVHEPLPIATSGEMKIMPPSTGLPAAQQRRNPLGGLIDSIPSVETETADRETVAHGD